jgi:aminopeptidase N
MAGVVLAVAVATLRGPASSASDAPGRGAREASVRADIGVTLDPAARELSAGGRWRLPAGRAWHVSLDARYEIERLALDGRPVVPPPNPASGPWQWTLPAAPRERRVEIAWRGRLDPLEASLDHRDVLTFAAPVAAPRGSFLPGASLWHPVFEGGPLDYRVRIDLPAGQRAIVPGTLESESTAGSRSEQSYALERAEPMIDLMAGPYEESRRRYAGAGGRSILLRTLYYPEIAGRASGDLDAVERYLRLYESWIGSYPYDSFSIVASPTPTGFGMPSLTYIGVDVLRLPFIRDTSLGHEVLHNWWGHGVRPDYARGNWSEGLTTFMADYAYREQSGDAAAQELRLSWLRDFASLGGAEDQPLAAFRARTHGAEQIVGYDKSAMVFVMLRDAIGRAAFDSAVQAFWREHRGGTASWDDLRDAFERASGRRLAAYFEQWLTRRGAPDPRLAAASATRDGALWRVAITLAQSAPAWRVRVPVVLGLADGSEATRWLDLAAEHARFEVTAEQQPLRVWLDPGARVFRRLAPGEAPPILRQSMLDPATVTVLAGAGTESESLARRLVEQPLRLLGADRAPPDGPLLVIGRDAEVRSYLASHGLPARPVELRVEPDRATAWAWTATRRGGSTLTVVAARDAAALAALERPLPHYGRQSWLVFDGPRAIARGVWPSQPQELALAPPSR